MGISQTIMLVLLGITLLINANEHGKEKTGNHNFWLSAISVGLYLTLLITGGFFK